MTNQNYSLNDLISFELQRDPEYIEKLKKQKEEKVNSFSSQVQRSIAGTKKAMYDGLTAVGTAVEQKTGEDSTVTDFLQDVGKRNSTRQQKVLESLGSPTETTDFWKIKSIGDAKEFGKQSAGSVAGSLGVQLGLGTAARFGLKLAGFHPAGRVGRFLFNMLPVSPLFAQGIGSVYRSAIEKGATDEEAAEKSLLAGLANGLIDTVFVGKILSKIYNPVKASAKTAELTKRSLAGSIASDTTKLATTGAVTEGLVAANTEIASDKIAGRETDTKEVAKRAINDAVVGTIGGTAVGPVTGALSKVQTDALIEQQKESDEFIKLSEQIEKEDAYNASVVKRSTATIERLEKIIENIDKKADRLNTKISGNKYFDTANESLNKLKEREAKILDEYKASRDNALPNESKAKRIELKKIQDEIKKFNIDRQQELRYSNKAGKMKANIQKRINKEKAQLLDAKSKGQNKGNIFITPQMLSGADPKGIRGLISKLYDGSMVQKLLGRATSPLRRAAIRNYKEHGDTSMFRIYNNFEGFYPETQARAGSYLSPILEAVTEGGPIARTGVRDALNLATTGLVKQSSIISTKDQKLLTEALMNDKGYMLRKYGDTRKARRFEEMRSKIRPILDKAKKDADAAGIGDGSYVKNYIPYKHNVTDKTKDKWLEIARKHKIKENEAQGIVESIINEGGFYFNVLRPKKKQIPGRVVNVNLETRRKLPKEMIADLKAEGLIDDNFLEMIPSYIMKLSKAIEYENRFKGIDRLVENLKTQNRITDNEFNTIGNTLDAIQGKYGTQIPRGWGGQTPYRWLLSLAYMATLPLAALTALSEPLILLSRAKPGSALVSAIKLPINAFMRTARIFLPRIKKSPTEKAFQEIMYGLDGSLTERLNSSSTIETPRRMTDAFFKATMLTQVTQLSRQMAFNTFKNELKTDMSSIVKGNLQGTVRGLELTRKYQEVGIPNIFKLVNDIQGKPFNKVFTESSIIKAASLKYVDDFIMTPNPTNRPLWMSSPALAAAAQLKSFSFVFGNTVGFRLLKNLIGSNRTPTQRVNTLFRYGVALSMIMLVAMFTDLTKEMFKTAGSDEPIKDLDDLLKKKKELKQNYLFDVIAGTNIFGGMTSLQMALKSARYGSSPLLGLLAGPVGTKLDEFLKAVSNRFTSSDKTKADKRIVRELLRTHPVFAVNKEARDNAIDIIIGEDDNFNSYEDFNKEFDLDF